MTREDVYYACTEWFYGTSYGTEREIVAVKELLPQKAIDAIIDCAVEEAVKQIKHMTFAINNDLGIPIAKGRYVEGGESE